MQILEHQLEVFQRENEKAENVELFPHQVKPTRFALCMVRAHVPAREGSALEAAVCIQVEAAWHPSLLCSAHLYPGEGLDVLYTPLDLPHDHEGGLLWTAHILQQLESTSEAVSEHTVVITCNQQHYAWELHAVEENSPSKSKSAHPTAYPFFVARWPTLL